MAKVQRDSARERHWRELVSAWQSSGLSVRAFCSERQIKEPAFYAWRRELQKRDAANTPASFVRVTVVPTPMLVEIRCPSGRVVTLTQADCETLRHLFAALVPASC